MSREAKYREGQKVLIDRVFAIEENTGIIKKLPEPYEAIVTKVDATPSLGPCYSIEWVDKSLPKSKIKYWEDDILGPVKD